MSVVTEELKFTLCNLKFAKTNKVYLIVSLNFIWIVAGFRFKSAVVVHFKLGLDMCVF